MSIREFKRYGVCRKPRSVTPAPRRSASPRVKDIAKGSEGRGMARLTGVHRRRDRHPSRRTLGEAEDSTIFINATPTIRRAREVDQGNVDGSYPDELRLRTHRRSKRPSPTMRAQVWRKSIRSMRRTTYAQTALSKGTRTPNGSAPNVPQRRLTDRHPRSIIERPLKTVLIAQRTGILRQREQEESKREKRNETQRRTWAQ
ncbi:hypothetical protein DFP72DRAFT_1054326 [Ephemerocybe angulata]|uniref:Uncharacterized protein n=1 Tax=Ephemerocybe angulata TaxID=980116 RepID=A0A8H6H824_9AGAR|nr:hypothetical protein DFP72DRAFT_1054326 [Tulosesus angulatus]